MLLLSFRPRRVFALRETRRHQSSATPGYGGSDEGKDHIPSLPYLPPKQLPAQPAPQQPTTATPPTTRPRTPKPNPVLNTRKVVENKAVTSTPFKQPQEEKDKQNIKGIPTKEQESLADELIGKDKERIKREAGDGDVIIRVIFEGARKPDGDHDDTIIEQEIKKGNPNKPKEIYQIYVKGLTEYNGLTAAGSIIRRWITEPPQPIDPVELIPQKTIPIKNNPWEPLTTNMIPINPPPTLRHPTPNPTPGILIPRENIEGGVAIESPLMTQDMKDYIDKLAKEWAHSAIVEIEIIVNIGIGIMNDWNKVARGGMLTVDANSGRVAIESKGLKKKVPNNNNSLILDNAKSAINDMEQYVKSLFKGVNITKNINFGTTNKGVTFTFWPKTR